jgi:hypothetical protein
VPGGGWAWLITTGSIAIGVIVVVALRQVMFRREE